MDVMDKGMLLWKLKPPGTSPGVMEDLLVLVILCEGVFHLHQGFKSVYVVLH